ncbi:MAG: hypothetical protein SynsKO_12910 [Synoicihabitans sp.]
MVHGHEGGQILTADGKVISDLGVEHYEYFNYGFLQTRLRLPKPEKVAGTVAVIAHPAGFQNYSHWLYDVLPRFEILKRAGVFDDVDLFLIGDTGRPYQTETLDFLGIPSSKRARLTAETFLQADRVLVPTHARYHHVAHPPWLTQWLRKTFIPVENLNKKPHRRIFLSRRCDRFRQLRQEEELCQRLEPLGFECVTLNSLTVSETAELMSECEMVVGVFGSALMNVCFCPRHTQVIEIATPLFYNCHHWHVSAETGLRHATYFGDPGILPAKRPLKPIGADIFIDVQDCENFIRQFLPSAGQTPSI